MKILKIVLAAIPALLLLLALIAPLGPVPGLFIGGTEMTAPATWTDTSDTDEIKLKVPGTIPRVVTIWVIEYNEELHVVGSLESGWVKMVGAESPVEMRLGDNTYALQATQITEDWQPILEAYVAKYEADYPEIVAGFPPIEEAKSSIAVFRLNRS